MKDRLRIQYHRLFQQRSIRSSAALITAVTKTTKERQRKPTMTETLCASQAVESEISKRTKKKYKRTRAGEDEDGMVDSDSLGNGSQPPPKDSSKTFFSTRDMLAGEKDGSTDWEEWSGQENRTMMRLRKWQANSN